MEKVLHILKWCEDIKEFENIILTMKIPFYIRLNRPQAMNALCNALNNDLIDALSIVKRILVRIDCNRK